MWEFARDAGFWVSTELGPHTPDLAALFDELHVRNLVTAQHAFNHCYDLPDRVWERSAAAARRSTSAPARRRLRPGIHGPPRAQALRYAAAVGLSNDNEVSYGIDMFAEMQTLQSRHRGEAFRRLAGGEALRADELTPARLLEFATAGGAANAGLPTRSARSPPASRPTSSSSTRTAAPPSPRRPNRHRHLVRPGGGLDPVLVAGAIRKRHAGWWVETSPPRAPSLPPPATTY